MITLALCLLPLVATPQDRISIRITEENLDLYCDVEALGCQVHQVMNRLCRELGDRKLTGFEDVEESAEINVYLRHRPLSQTVEYILGAAGLSGTVGRNRIDVRGQLPPFPERKSILEAAEIAYLTALRRFPDSDQACTARMELATIAVEQGTPEKAVRQYELLLEDYPSCEEVTEAHLKAGRLLVELEDWERAEPHFLALGDVEIDASNPDALPVITEARRELARCVLMRGDARRALYMLLGLNQAIPPATNEDRAVRALLVARAQLGVGDHVKALIYLDEAQSYGTGVVGEFEGMDLRARALELSGRPIDAAVAWLHFSRSKPLDLQRRALEESAKLALSVDGEELAVLFLHGYAIEQGAGDVLLPFVNEARSRLGLDSDSYAEGTPTTRLRRAEQLVASGLNEEAAHLLGGMEREIEGLSAADRLSFGLTYALLLEEFESVDSALLTLRDVARTLESTENRKPIYRLAAEICERHGRFDQAAAAYGGQL